MSFYLNIFLIFTPSTQQRGGFKSNHPLTQHNRYPDMKLWQEIIFLKQWFKGKWVVENIIPYYETFIQTCTLIDRHLFWSNFIIPKIKWNRTWNIANARVSTRRPTKDELIDLSKYLGFDLSKYKIKNKRVLLRNCVHPKIGLHIFNCAFKTKQMTFINVPVKKTYKKTIL